MPRGLVPRSLFDFPSFRIPSLFEDIDDLLAFPEISTVSQGGLTISEDDKNVYVEAAVPGVNPEDVEVTMDKGVLWIRGEAKEEEKDKKRKYYRKAQRVFSYRVAVPGEIDPNAEPQAEYKNGMVMITFPKLPQAQPKKITVKAESKSSNGKKAKDGKK